MSSDAIDTTATAGAALPLSLASGFMSTPPANAFELQFSSRGAWRMEFAVPPAPGYERHYTWWFSVFWSCSRQ
jgi:hypothetical protein